MSPMFKSAMLGLLFSSAVSSHADGEDRKIYKMNCSVQKAETTYKHDRYGQPTEIELRLEYTKEFRTDIINETSMVTSVLTFRIPSTGLSNGATRKLKGPSMGMMKITKVANTGRNQLYGYSGGYLDADGKTVGDDLFELRDVLTPDSNSGVEYIEVVGKITIDEDFVANVRCSKFMKQ